MVYPSGAKTELFAIRYNQNNVSLPTKVGADFLEALVKHRGFLTQGILSQAAKLLYVKHPTVPVPASPL